MRLASRFRFVPAVLSKVLPPLLFVLSIGFLGFVAGSYVMYANAFPHQHLANAYNGGTALFAQKTLYNTEYPSDLWQPARTEARAVTIHDTTRTQPGYTLYTSGHDHTALLISMDGEVVHQWTLPFSAVWDETADVKVPRPDSQIYYRKAYLYPNGDLLAIYEAAGDTPWGYGLVKMDKNSKPIWKYLQRVHHDLDVAPTGEIYTLTHEIRDTVIRRWRHLKPPRVDDFVVVLSPDGQELRKVSVLDAFVASPYARMLSTVAWYSKDDFVHTNTINVVAEDAAQRLSGAAGHQVLLSMRELGAIGLLDLDREVFTWALRGPWLGQHDPDLLPNGNMLLFDNFGHFGGHGMSRVIEFDPQSFQIVWSYAGDEDRPLSSRVRSAQERLANGNTLITESEGGRLLEVAPDGKIVWEYINPLRGGEASDLVPVVSWGQRIDPTKLDPTFLAALTS